MKHYLLALSLLAAPVAMAQHPNATFKQKEKTSAPTPGLVERLNAEERGLPQVRANRRATLATGNMTIETLPLRVVRDGATGQPIFIERKPSARLAAQPANRQRARLSAEAVSATTLRFVSQVGSLLKLDKPEAKFVVGHTETDELGQTHVRLTQNHRGVPVLGADLVAHLTDGEVTLLNGRYKAVPENLSVVPSLTLEQASALALADVKKETAVRTFGDNLFRMKQSTGSLCVFPQEKGAARLAYQLTVRPNMIERWEYVIDAQTGDVLEKYDHTCTVVADGPKPASGKDLNGTTRSFQTYQQGSTYYMIDASRPMFSAAKSTMPDKPVGGIMTRDAKGAKDNGLITSSQITSTNNTNWNANAVSAHYNAGLAYDYFKKTFSRNSLDGSGGTIVSVINITDEDGDPMDNAFWNGEFMGYGNGSTLFKPLAGALDVAGHEMTHGVISKTANLEYMGQSGAMNEAFADIFGAMIDRANWTMAETVVLPGAYKSGAMRDLSNPNQGGKSLSDRGYQPATMAQYEDLPKNRSNDNGGVHINSGIVNFTYYKFATAIGKEKAEQVFYRALTTYLVRTSQFLDLRLAVIKSAGDLYGATGAEVTAAKAAFDATGIVEGTDSKPDPTKPDLPVATGEDLMLLTEVSESQLYSTKMAVSPASFEQKTKSALTHRPSVTDDGQTAYYVSSDKKIRSVNLTGTPEEFIVSDQPIWDNVAISKDGTKLAALTADRDTSIYVYSFGLKKWARFKLYTPTYTEGVQTNNVLYADSFEWDFSGQYLVYDAYNSGGAISDYWDVNAIEVWDNKASTFADGYTERLFPSLDEGESVGNPSFSKNSPNILAFDYMNTNDETYYIALADLKTGKAALAYQNNTLGFPNYSRLDDKLVFNRLDDDEKEAVSGILLGDDKLSVSGEAVQLYSGAKWPVWYTQTKRELPNKVAQTITFAAIADQSMSQTTLALKATSTSKLTVGFRVKSGPATLNGTTLKLTGKGTVVVQAFQNGNDQYSAAAVVERSFNVLASKGLIDNSLVAVSDEPTWSDLVKVYPNPVSTKLTVDVPDSQTLGAVGLWNISGVALQQPVLDTSATSTTLDVSQLPTGIYILQIQTAAGVTNRKIVKE